MIGNLEIEKILKKEFNVKFEDLKIRSIKKRFDKIILLNDDISNYILQLDENNLISVFEKLTEKDMITCLSQKNNSTIFDNFLEICHDENNNLCFFHIEKKIIFTDKDRYCLFFDNKKSIDVQKDNGEYNLKYDISLEMIYTLSNNVKG